MKALLRCRLSARLSQQHSQIKSAHPCKINGNYPQRHFHVPDGTVLEGGDNKQLRHDHETSRARNAADGQSERVNPVALSAFNCTVTNSGNPKQTNRKLRPAQISPRMVKTSLVRSGQDRANQGKSGQVTLENQWHSQP